MADENKKSVTLNRNFPIAGKRYEEGESVEVFDYEADQLVARGIASEGSSKSKSKSSSSKDEGK